MSGERPTLEPVQRDWYSVADVAIKLGMSKATIRKMVRGGQLQAHRMAGKLVRIHRDEIRRFEDGVTSQEGE